MKRITGRRIASIVLTLCMVLGLAPEQAFASDTSQTKYADINDFQEARWAQIESEVFKSTSGSFGGVFGKGDSRCIGCRYALG